MTSVLTLVFLALYDYCTNISAYTPPLPLPMAVVMFISVFNIECLYAVQSFDGGQSIPDSVHGDAGSGSESEDEFGYTKSE